MTSRAGAHENFRGPRFHAGCGKVTERTSKGECKPCRNAHTKAWRGTHEEWRTAYRILNMSQELADQRLRRTEQRGFRAQIKMDAGCKDCGYNQHHAALDFDHVHGEKAVSMSNASPGQFLAELPKCEVVCANCHRIRTYKKLQYNKRNAE